jgi:hypothetical protein
VTALTRADTLARRPRRCAYVWDGRQPLHSIYLRTLFRLIRGAQAMEPGQRRMLFLDIEGHWQADAMFDADMRAMSCDCMEYHRRSARSAAAN